MEKGMSPSRLLEDKFLDQKESQQQAMLLQVKTKQHDEAVQKPTYST
jgi:hypothetical protein